MTRLGAVLLGALLVTAACGHPTRGTAETGPGVMPPPGLIVMPPLTPIAGPPAPLGSRLIITIGVPPCALETPPCFTVDFNVVPEP